MANLGTMFNANAVAPATGEGQPVIAPGVYTAMMTESDPSQPNDKGNSYLKCIFEVMEGQHKGTKLTHRLNLWNQTPKAVEIATQEFSAMCHAVMDEAERSQVSDSSQLHGRPMEITVAVETFTKSDNTTGHSNKITKFARLGTASAGMASVQPAVQAYAAQPQAGYANTAAVAQPQQQPQAAVVGTQNVAQQPQGFAAPVQGNAPAQQGFGAAPAKPDWAR